MVTIFHRQTQIIPKYKTDKANNSGNHKIDEQRQRRDLFASSVCSIINLLAIQGLKVASAERNNVLCMRVSMLENK